MKHLIRREVFELNTSNSKEGFECQQRASYYIHSLINPLLDACFENLALGDQHLVIDKLEIDLGSFTADNLEKELVVRLRKILEKQLRKYMQTARKEITELSETKVQLLNDVKTFYYLLHYFLQHGRLPWWYETAKQQAPPEELFSIQFIETLTVEDKQSLKEVLLTSKEARIRLVNHFDTEWIVRFLQHLDMPVSKSAEQWHVLLPAVKEFAALQTIFHQYFWIEAMSGTINISLVIEKAARGYNDTAVALARAIHSICKVNSIKNETVWAGYTEQIEKYLAHKMPYDDFRKQDIRAIATQTVFTGNEQGHKHNVPDPIITNQAISKEEKEQLQQHGLFVSAGGLVILHPFLTELFTSTGLWHDKEWRDENSVYRAVQLLSQLAYGETGLPEYQLSFIKILLGIDIEAPLPAQEPLTEQEQQTCTGLLQAVIGHWTALRNTGPAAVQEGFLQRPGKLIENKKGYHLTVERLAQDVLLSRLPWGYSMIKLPWMNNMLHVTWL